MALHKNKIWVSTIDNIYEIRRDCLIPLYRHIPGGDYFSFYVDSKNRLWLAGKDYLKISKADNFRYFTDSLYNQFGYIFQISEDSDRNIWIGTGIKPPGGNMH